MARRSKGPRLYLRAGRADRNSEAVWVIRDGSREISTGCGPDSLSGSDGAEAKLAAYIASKWTPDEAQRTGDPADVLVAEALAFYAQKRAPKLADPKATAVRVKTLLTWWGDKTLADVKMSTCEAYVEHRVQQPLAQAKTEAALLKRVSPAGARRELEDLSAAIGFWAKEYPLNPRPIVTLPLKPESARDALTRSQAARLLKAAMGWRWLPDQKRWERLSRSAISNRAHLRRFILIALYTGTRPGVIPKLLWVESPVQAWVDLESATIYRRGKQEREHRTKRRPLVRMPARLLAHMRRWHSLDEAAAIAARQEDSDAPPLVSVLHHGGAPISGRIRRGFESCVRDAGLEGEITPHWMRHTCATWLMENDCPLWDAAAYAGMSTAVLEKHYGHHRPDHQQKARRALGGNR